MEIRQAQEKDAVGMSATLSDLAAAGKRTKPSDVAFVLNHYILHPDRIACHVALDGQGRILGFQSLKLARPGNIYAVTPGWGIIGTHIRPDTARRGVGRALFEATRAAALASNLERIDATIGKWNADGLAYYEAVGFRTYERIDGAVRKVFQLTRASDSPEVRRLPGIH